MYSLLAYQERQRRRAALRVEHRGRVEHPRRDGHQRPIEARVVDDAHDADRDPRGSLWRNADAHLVPDAHAVQLQGILAHDSLDDRPFRAVQHGRTRIRAGEYLEVRLAVRQVPDDRGGRNESRWGLRRPGVDPKIVGADDALSPAVGGQDVPLHGVVHDPFDLPETRLGEDEIVGEDIGRRPRPAEVVDLEVQAQLR